MFWNYETKAMHIMDAHPALGKNARDMKSWQRQRLSIGYRPTLLYRSYNIIMWRCNDSGFMKSTVRGTVVSTRCHEQIKSVCPSIEVYVSCLRFFNSKMSKSSLWHIQFHNGTPSNDSLLVVPLSPSMVKPSKTSKKMQPGGIAKYPNGSIFTRVD